MSASELRDWLAFDDIEPIGDIRRDIMLATIAQTIIAVNATKKEKIPSLETLIPFLEKPEQDTKSLLNQLLGT